MLQKIGSRTKTVLGFLLFVPIIASFLIWGISDMLKAAGVARYAATVGNTTISTQAFAQELQRQLAGYKQRGININAEMMAQLGIAQQVLRGQIERALLLHAVQDEGLVIPDSVLAAEIQNEKAFKDDKGRFSREKFKTLLTNSGLNETAFLTGLREDMAIRTLVNAIAGAATPPAALPTALYKREKTTYRAEVLTLPVSSVSGARAPTEKELADYYAAHKDQYQRPEIRRGTLAVLSVKNFEAGTMPSAEDLKKLYESRKVEFSIPEERSAQFIAVQDEAKAKQIAERARGGEKLAAAASDVMGAPTELKKMEGVKAGNLPEDLDRALFKLPRGETSEPVKTPLGWYVMQITTIKAGVIPTLDRVKPRLIAAWQKEQASTSLPKTLNQLDDAVAGGESLDALAKTYHLQLRALPAVDSLGKGKDTDLSADAALRPAISAMFKQKQGELGNLFELPGGDYALLRVDEIIPQHIPPLTEISAAVTADWKKANSRQLAEGLARKLASDWRKTDDISATANTIGASLSVRNDISHSKKPQTAIDRAVLKSGAVGDVVTTTDGNVEYIAKIRAINRPAVPAANDAALAPFRAQAAEAVKGDYLQIYLNALEKRYAVEVNEKAVKQAESMAN